MKDPNIAIESLISIIKNCINLSSINRKKQSKSDPHNKCITRAIIDSCDQNNFYIRNAKWKRIMK